MAVAAVAGRLRLGRRAGSIARSAAGHAPQAGGWLAPRARWRGRPGRIPLPRQVDAAAAAPARGRMGVEYRTLLDPTQPRVHLESTLG
ncbi:MAG: hypothetical protein ACK5N0_09650 [Synechococcaceae cyanobacterium]